MLIWQIEAALERAWLFLAMAHSEVTWLDRPGEKLAEVRRFVEQTEKPYEPHVPDWDDWQPPNKLVPSTKATPSATHCRNDEIDRQQTEIDAQDRIH